MDYKNEIIDMPSNDPAFKRREVIKIKVLSPNQARLKRLLGNYLLFSSFLFKKLTPLFVISNVSISPPTEGNAGSNLI